MDAINGNDAVNHPQHYLAKNIKLNCDKCKTNKVIECIDVSRHFNFNLGNALKYIWRSEFKGNQIQDLQKALWYIQDEINRINGNI